MALVMDVAHKQSPRGLARIDASRNRLDRPRWGMARKLLIAFGLLLGIFGSASYFALTGLLDLHRALHQVEIDAGRLQAVLRLASAVRDQYAHMAHTMIIGDESHLAMYQDAERSVRANLAEVLRRPPPAPASDLLEDIRQASARLDELFRGRLLAAVKAGDRARSAALHEEVLTIVSGAQEKAQKLAAISETAIVGFRQHASVVQHAAIRWVIILLASAVLCAAGIGFFLFRSIARPVASLAAGAIRLGRGDLDTQIEIHSLDELGQLAAQFNAMTAALKDHQARLMQTEKLAGIGRLAAGVAHEINNPLGVILGYVKLLRRKADPGVASDLKVIEDEAERCRVVVEDLLDLTRTPPLEADSVDLRILTEDVVERLKVASEKPGVSVAIKGDATIVGSDRKLRQVMHNLVKNAAEAIGGSGGVHVSIETPERGQVAITVRDTGPGISVQSRPLVFEPFFTTKPTGTGLGLAVSRAIARAHGGELELVDAGPGGAVFRLSLPDRSRAT